MKSKETENSGTIYEREKRQILQGSVYNLRLWGKAQNATLCSY
jgi:hypothetical protein